MNLIPYRIRRFNRKSERAIARFLSTEQALIKSAEELDVVIADINVKQAELNAQKVDATNLKNENIGIARRIGAIVRGGE